MFARKKDVKELEKKVDYLVQMLIEQQEEINELKKDKEPKYFG